MKYDAVARLQECVSPLLEGGRVHDSQILDLFRKTRLVLEHKRLKSNYPTIALYSDWLQHTEIDRHPSVWALIESIDTIFTKDADSASLKDDIQTINNAFALRMFRHELLALYRSLGINTYLFAAFGNWNEILTTILSDVAQRPLRFPDLPRPKAATLILDRMAANRLARKKNPAHRVTSVRVLDRRGETAASGFTPGFYFAIRMREEDDSHYAELIGGLSLAETRADFEAD